MRIKQLPLLVWRSRFGALFLLACAILLPRALTIDQFVTIDEDTWLTRSANFAVALAQGNLAQTYQSEHPGVTTMWAGTTGLRLLLPSLGDQEQGAIGSSRLRALLRQEGREPLEALATARLVMVLANSLVLIPAYAVARQIMDPLAAFAGFLLLALEPFFMAHTQLLHLDGLLSSLLLLSLLAFLHFLRRRRLAFLLLSGAAFGLALLTKAPALFLGPPLLLILAFTGARRPETARPVPWAWRLLWPFVLWGLVALAVVVAVWPAMWVAPQETVTGVIGGALGYAEAGHESPVFFRGRILPDGQLGPLFYPVSLLWRSSPALLLGLVLVLVAAVERRGPVNDRNRATAGGLLIFALLFLLQLTLSSKKFDRYLLPLWGPLALLAGMGWASLAHTLRKIAQQRQWHTASAHAAGPLLSLALVLVLQLAVIAQVYPTYLSYYNPLMGGREKAPQAMTIGWGEGLEEAAAYLNSKPDAQSLTVISWYGTVFSYFFEGETINIDNTTDISPGHLQALLQADYAVLYIHQWQRHLPISVIDTFAEMNPEKRISVNGLEYAQIYRLRDEQ